MNNAPIAEAVPLIAQAREIEVRRQGALIEFALNRPKVLNAFNDGMRRVLALELPEIARNPDIYVVALTSTATKAFCAGGDVKAVRAEARRDIKSAKAFFAGEYALNWLLECFSKPTVSLADGLCKGSGVGLSVYNTHRVAAENYKFAMPETAIGLFPDVGAAHVLAHLPWPLGLYLGLTGRVIDRADAYWLDLVTHCIPAHRFGGILAALYHRKANGGAGQHVDVCLFDTVIASLSHYAQIFLVNGQTPPRRGTWGNGGMPAGVFRCTDGELMLVVGNDGQFARTCAVLGQPELATDPRFVKNNDRVVHGKEIMAIFAGLFLKQPVAHWLE